MSDVDDPNGILVRGPWRGDSSYVPPPIADYGDTILPPEDVSAAPPESPEETTMRLPTIPAAPDPATALRSEGITPPEVAEDDGEYEEGEYVQPRSLADRLGDWLELRLEMVRANHESEMPFREAEVARKAALLEGRTAQEVAMMEQNGKLHAAMMKAKGDKAAARGKADADRMKSPSSGLGADKGRSKAGGGSGSSRGGGGGPSRSNSLGTNRSGAQRGGSNSGGPGRRSGSGSTGTGAKGGPKGSERGSGGRTPGPRSNGGKGDRRALSRALADPGGAAARRGAGGRRPTLVLSARVVARTGLVLVRAPGWTGAAPDTAPASTTGARTANRPAPTGSRHGRTAGRRGRGGRRHGRRSGKPRRRPMRAAPRWARPSARKPGGASTSAAPTRRPPQMPRGRAPTARTTRVPRKLLAGPPVPGMTPRRPMSPARATRVLTGRLTARRSAAGSGAAPVVLAGPDDGVAPAALGAAPGVPVVRRVPVGAPGRAGRHIAGSGRRPLRRWSGPTTPAVRRSPPARPRTTSSTRTSSPTPQQA